MKILHLCGAFTLALLIALHAESADERIVDTHFHAMSCQPDGLAPAAEWMTQNKVSRLIVHPIDTSRDKNDQDRSTMLANFKKYQGKIERTCIIKPDEVNSLAEAVKILEQEKQDGAIGFGEHYGPGLFFDDPKNQILYAACAKVGLPVMFHMDHDRNMDTEGLPHLENALKANPECIFIAHGPLWWKQFSNGTCDRLLGKYPNFYADISAGSGAKALGKDLAITAEFMAKHSTKLLFGTDCGWWSFKKDEKPAPQFQMLKSLKLDDDAKSRIYHGNADRLFGLK